MEMKQKDRIKLEFLPDRIINADFISYPDFCYMFYQFQKKNIVYAMAARFDGNGKLLGKEILMDTTQISFLANNKLYSVVNSDDKQYIDLFKINSKNDDRFVVTTMLFDKNMVQKEKVTCVCTRARVRTCVCACACVRVHVHAYVCVCMGMRACTRACVNMSHFFQKNFSNDGAHAHVHAHALMHMRTHTCLRI